MECCHVNNQDFIYYFKLFIGPICHFFLFSDSVVLGSNDSVLLFFFPILLKPERYCMTSSISIPPQLSREKSLCNCNTTTCQCPSTLCFPPVIGSSLPNSASTPESSSLKCQLLRSEFLRGDSKVRVLFKWFIK